MTGQWHGLAAALLLLAAVPAPTAKAANGGVRIRCVKTDVHVNAGSRKDALLACTSARRTLRHLGRIGVVLRNQLAIDIVPGSSLAGGMQSYGRFDPDANRVSVARPADIGKLRREQDPYSALPPRALFRSVLAHELVHAALQSNDLPMSRDRIAQEYMAYAIEIQLMGPRSRRAFLRAAPVVVSNDLGQFTELGLAFAPQAFGAAAYRHYSGVRDRPAFLAGVLQGSIRFPTASDDME